MTEMQTLWNTLRQEAEWQQQQNPLLENFFQSCILQHDSLISAISYVLAKKLQTDFLSSDRLYTLFHEYYQADPGLAEYLCADLDAVLMRDSACHHFYQAFCFYKGFHALATYRVMHALWQEGKTVLALQLQQRMSSVFDVDIHPATQIGTGIMLDHATGIVIGETAVVGNHVSLMQGVTLGGTGKAGGDRHPKIRDGVLISVGAVILGNIEVGEGAQVAAGSVVLKAVPAHAIVAGVPAEVVGKANSATPALTMDHRITC